MMVAAILLGPFLQVGNAPIIKCSHQQPPSPRQQCILVNSSCTQDAVHALQQLSQSPPWSYPATSFCPPCHGPTCLNL
jgi:hypothetical protein